MCSSDLVMSVGCIQAQICHTGHCPTGVTTQDPVRQRALVVADKAPRVTQYHANTLNALRELLQSAGLTHPDELTPYHIVRRISDSRIRLMAAVMKSIKPNAILDDLKNQQRIFRLYWPLANAYSFAPRMPMAGEAPLDPSTKRRIHKGASHASPDQIARELQSLHAPHPEPQTDVVPEQAADPEVAPQDASSVPDAWTDSGAEEVETAEEEDTEVVAEDKQ